MNGKKIIELKKMTTDGEEWSIIMITEKDSEFWQETWVKKITDVNSELWQTIRRFMAENRTNYKVLSYFLKENDFIVTYKHCKIYPTYWDANGDPDRHLMYAGKKVDYIRRFREIKNV